MSRKGFLVKVEFDVQKVTCPGVWLCSNGKVSLQIHMFGSAVQTRNCKPAFPLIIYEKFVFSKIFHQDRRLNELQRRLNNEWFYVELIQWKSCDEGRVLATFRTTLDELLYPTSFRNSIMGVNIDLLMESSEIFPGKLAPKLEISTKTTVEETIFDSDCQHSNVTLINPKAIFCKPLSDENKGVPRKVCHSVGFSRAQRNIPTKKKKSRPPFKYSKVSDDLILRNNPNIVLRSEYQVANKKKPRCCYCTNRVVRPCTECDCKFEGTSHEKSCAVCSLYDGYFTETSAAASDKPHNISTDYESKKLCDFCKKDYKNIGKYHVTSKDGFPCDSDSDFSERSRKICLCLPGNRTTSLAQQLHERLSRTLDANSRVLQHCVDCRT
ncbi:spermatogenesis-associated protein 6 [Diorhabda carinulata]|uniref:spermatogenesis-associated protein 6 n=1 Tax=Diorhabda carinulata TaxID=1163345 RepID=UPI0025A1C1D8|nr:spermatogenesis-associated protein 6 [Diorhabda carinulata]